MSATTRRGGFGDFLGAVTSGVKSLDWSEWIAVAGEAAVHPDDWVAAVQSLSAQEQFDLLALLRREDAGPFADHLLLLTSRHANELEDPQVRDFLLQDAQVAADRTLAFMERQRDAMRALLENAEQRRADVMDVAAEVTLLEKRLAELRLADIETEYERVNDLEREIARLEAVQRSLVAYDAGERSAVKEQLQQSTAALRATRDALEASMAEAIAERDAAQRQADESADQLAKLQSETEELRAKNMDDAARLVQLTESISRLGSETRQLRAQRTDQEAALASEEQAQLAVRQAIEQDAARLRELRQSRPALANQEISQRLEELWRLLPEDLADPEFTT